MLWGCVPMVVFCFGLMGTSTLHCRDVSPWSYFVSSLGFCHLMGTYTLRCGDASLWSYFISDSAISWVPPPYAVGMRPHSRISFSVNNLMGTYTLHCGDASPWSYLALVVKLSPRFVSQGHLHPLISVVSSRHPNPSRNSFLHGTSVCAY